VFKPGSVDTIFYRPVQIQIWNKALSAYNNRRYRPCIELLTLLYSCIELKNQDNPSKLDKYIPETLTSQALEVEGICRYFMNEIESAKKIENSIDESQPDYFAQRAPNLRLLLRYDYVDTLSQNRIRVRKEQKYGFLDEHGTPLWSGDQLPFDHAFHFHNSEAIIILGSQQCRVGLDCKVDLTRCVALLGDIHGIVVDSATGKPIVNAIIRAADSGTVTVDELRAGNVPGIYTSTTNSLGRYTLQALPDIPNLLIYAQAVGYQSNILPNHWRNSRH
jgi:hypothetical protein